MAFDLLPGHPETDWVVKAKVSVGTASMRTFTEKMEPQREQSLQRSEPEVAGEDPVSNAGHSAPDGCWPLDPRERGDVLHRIRSFPEDVHEWREQLASELLACAKRIRDPVDMDGARALIDEGVSLARTVARLLQVLYADRALPDGTSAKDAARVLKRLQPFQGCGPVFGAEIPRLRRRIEDALPPRLMASMQTLLGHHGREVCTARNPACDGCEFSRICTHRREQLATSFASSTKPVVSDLFCGAGGLSEGFRRAGFHVGFAADFDRVAMKTWRLNHPEVGDDASLCMDIRTLDARTIRRALGRRTLAVLIGAPPCQGFSSAGFRSKRTRLGYKASADDRNDLFEEMVRLALELRPPLFLMENVPGMETARRQDTTYLEEAARRLEEGGYRTSVWRLTAAAFGVPQERFRCFLVASKGPLPASPKEEYQNIRRADFDPDALPPITFDEATYDLPIRGPGEGTGIDAWQRQLPADDFRARRYLRKFRLTSRSSLIFNHYVRYHNERDLELYSLLKPGEDSAHVLERYGRSDLMRYRTDVFDDKYARLRGDRPSKTIVAHLAKDGNGYIHPTQVRSISIREAARLQGFQDDYVFCGSPSDQWVQIGNAVPPILGEVIARTFAEALERGS